MKPQLHSSNEEFVQLFKKYYPEFELDPSEYVEVELLENYIRVNITTIAGVRSVPTMIPELVKYARTYITSTGKLASVGI